MKKTLNQVLAALGIDGSHAPLATQRTSLPLSRLQHGVSTQYVAETGSQRQLQVVEGVTPDGHDGRMKTARLVRAEIGVSLQPIYRTKHG